MQSMAGQHIDQDKLRAAIRRAGNEYIFYMLDDAIELLPQAKLRKSTKDYLNLDELRSDEAEEQDLLAALSRSQRGTDGRTSRFCSPGY